MIDSKALERSCAKVMKSKRYGPNKMFVIHPRRLDMQLNGALKNNLRCGSPKQRSNWKMEMSWTPVCEDSVNICLKFKSNFTSLCSLSRLKWNLSFRQRYPRSKHRKGGGEGGEKGVMRQKILWLTECFPGYLPTCLSQSSNGLFYDRRAEAPGSRTGQPHPANT